MAQKQRNKSRDVHTALLRFRREKNWKHLYLRSEKLLRAAQLGMEYPRKTRRQLARQEWKSCYRIDQRAVCL